MNMSTSLQYINTLINLAQPNFGFKKSLVSPHIQFLVPMTPPELLDPSPGTPESQ